MITFNPNGGDLGRAHIKPIAALEMQIIIPHIANILEELAATKRFDSPLKYAFELNISEKDIAGYIIYTAKLPPHVHFYECDGKSLFEMRGASGGIVSGLICYLVTGDK